MFDLIKRRSATLATGISRFKSDADGNFKILTAAMITPIFLTVGVAVDTAETYRAKTQFQNAVDAAALMAGKTMTRTGSPTEAQIAGERVFLANLEHLEDSTGEIAFVIPQGECGTEGVTANATLDHPLHFGVSRAFANMYYDYEKEEHWNVELTATTTVTCGNKTLEIALVLDNSGSMNSSGKISTLRTAAAQLVNTVHDSMATSQQPDPVMFSLVPFSTFVNVGAGNENQSWMDQDGASSIHDEHLDWSTLAGATQDGSTNKWRDQNGNYLTRFTLYDELDINWKGCVEQRPYPHHTQDTTPTSSDPDTYFVPSFAPDTPDNLSYNDRYEQQFVTAQPYCVRWRRRVSNGCREWSDGYRGNYHPTEGYAYYYSAEYGYQGVWQGDTTGGNQWVNIGPQSEEWYQNNYLTDVHNFDTKGGADHAYNKTHMGTTDGNQYKRQKWASKYFNNANPRDVNSNRSSLPTVVGFEGGPNFFCTTAPLTDLTGDRQTVLDGITNMVATGSTNVQQGLAWGWRTLTEAAPFTNGRSKNITDNRKILIVMTDGNNTYYPIDTFYSGYSTRNRSYYGAFAHSVNDRIFDGYDDIANPNHDFNTFTKAMDSHLSETCVNAKADGIEIFSIAFNVPNGSSVKEMLELCASPKPGGKRYYDASNNAQLLEVFQSISEEIAELAITK